jgi:hypothetical protein
VSYTSTEWRTVEPVARQAEEQARVHPERRDLFLCHAWDDRTAAAKEFNDLLVSLGVTVWFSEKDVGLGKSLLREIDKGLANSRIGIVLVIPALLKSLAAEGIDDKEFSVLLATDRVIPVAHGTTFDALRDVSPMLAARSGLTTGTRRCRTSPPRSPPWRLGLPRTPPDGKRERADPRRAPHMNEAPSKADGASFMCSERITDLGFHPVDRPRKSGSTSRAGCSSPGAAGRS